MMPATQAMTLNQADIQALLASMLRARLLREHETPYLFGDKGKLHQTSLDETISGEEKNLFARQACSFFDLDEGEAARLAGMADLAGWSRAIMGIIGETPMQLAFSSSGFTGQPVHHATATALLAQEVQTALAPMFADRTRILALVPRHHIYGFLFTVLLPKCLGVPVVERAPIAIPSLINQFAGGDLVIAFPLFWDGAAKLGTAFPGGVQGTTSTGPCSPDTIRALIRLGLGRMTEIYGSTETIGMGARHDVDAPYELFPYWSRQATFDGSSDMLSRKLPDGGVKESIPVPDLVDWDSPRHFRPLRRKDKMVQVAGHNVNPQVVEDTLRKHPLVQNCTVRLMRPEEGFRLKAFVIPAITDELSDEEKRTLHLWLKEELPAHAVPKAISFGHALPMNELGKLCDW